MDEEGRLLQQLQAQRRSGRAIIVAIPCVLVIGPFVPIGWQYYRRWKEEQAERLTRDEEKELHRLLERMFAERAERDRAWQTAVDGSARSSSATGRARSA